MIDASLQLGVLFGLSIVGVTTIIVLLFTWGEEMISGLMERHRKRTESRETLRRPHTVTLRLTIEEKRIIETLSHDRSEPGARLSQEAFLRGLVHREAESVALLEDKHRENESETADTC